MRRRAWPDSNFIAACRALAMLALALALGSDGALAADALQRVPGPPPRAHAMPPVSGWRALDASVGLPQLTVYALAQDARGYVYAGTQAGLARYDGRRFERVPLGASAHDTVAQLLPDAAGRLWAGSDESGLYLLDGEDAIEVRLRSGARMPAIEALARERGTQRMWVGTPVGLYRCEPGGCDAMPDTQQLEVAELLEGSGPNGPCLWLGTNLDGLYRFDHAADGTLVRSAFHLDASGGLPNSAVRALAHFGSATDGSAALWIGTGRGLARLAGDTLTQYVAENGFPRGTVHALHVRERKGAAARMLATSHGGGLIEIAPDGSYYVTGLAEGLPEPYVYSVLLTGSGGDAAIWLGTASAGVLRLEPGRFHALDERDGLPRRGVVGVGELEFADGLHTVWAGTLGGSVRRVNGRWQPFLPLPYRDWVLYDMLRDPLGRTWLATGRGVLQIDGDTFREYGAENSVLPAVSAERLLWRGGADGTLWIATGHGIGLWRDGRLLAPYEDDPELKLLSVDAMLEVDDAAGASRLLLGTGSGLYDASGERPQRIEAPCLPHPEVLALARGSARTFWAGTRRGAARLRFDADALRCDALVETGGAPVVYAIARDDKQRIYLFGYDGVRRLTDPDEPLDGPQRYGLERYAIEDGLPSLEFNRSAFADRDGRIWAANSAGLVVFDPAHERASSAPAPLRLDAMHGRVPLEANAVLERDHGELAFRYRLLSFRDEHRIRYRTQLLGLEPRQGAWSDAAEKRYVRLPPGEYRFRVSARDGTGRHHGPVEQAFRIAPAWWQRAPVIVAAMLALLGLGLAAGRWRASALASRARTLERQVEERTHALADANRALERMSNTDPLTGAWNRRYFYSSVAGWAAEAANAGGLLLLLVDIDHFKQINDRHGHAAGDCVLVEVARRLARPDAERVELIRWGGEEFLIVVRRAGEVDPAHVARAALAAIADTPIAVGDEQLAVGASVGFTVCRPPAEGVDTHIDTIVARADDALYRAKAAGRARAVGAAVDPRDGRVVFEELTRSNEITGRP